MQNEYKTRTEQPHPHSLPSITSLLNNDASPQPDHAKNLNSDSIFLYHQKSTNPLPHGVPIQYYDDATSAKGDLYRHNQPHQYPSQQPTPQRHPINYFPSHLYDEYRPSVPPTKREREDSEALPSHESANKRNLPYPYGNLQSQSHQIQQPQLPYLGDFQSNPHHAIINPHSTTSDALSSFANILPNATTGMTLSAPVSPPVPSTPSKHHTMEDGVGHQQNDHLPPLSSGPSRFVLKEQPNQMQRKSYKKENRYLMPNPLILIARDKDEADVSSKGNTKWDKITTGKAVVKLVDGYGRALPASKELSLETSTGVFEQSFSSKSLIEFSLKVLENSGPEDYRVLFTIIWTTESGEQHREEILSSPFRVQSNKSLKLKERPKVFNINPRKGKTHKETEVWIRGNQFRKQGVIVYFGEIQGRVVEICDNIVVAYAPKRDDLTEDTLVKVDVANKYNRKQISADEQPIFLYKVKRKGNYKETSDELSTKLPSEKANEMG